MDTHENTSEKRMKKTLQLISIDFGLKRIGLAVGNNLTNSAQALTTLTTDKPFEISAELKTIIKEWQPNLLILGMPYNADGSEPKLVKSIKRFAKVLNDTFNLPIEYIDESFTSFEASKQLKDLRQSGKRKRSVSKSDIDKAAAAVMLQRWLDKHS